MLHTKDQTRKGRHPIVSKLTAAGLLAPRLLLLVGLLALILPLASTSRPVSAQTGCPPNEDCDTTVDGYMRINGFRSAPKITICVKQKKSVTVEVIRDLRTVTTDFLGGTEDLFIPNNPQKDIKVNATVSDKSIADLDANVKTTSLTGAKFVISGKKKGTTRVDFLAPMKKLPRETLNGPVAHPDSVGLNLSVTVINCKFSVSAASNWYIPGPAQIAIIATIHNAQLTGNDNSGILTGSGEVWWTAAAVPVGDCTGSVTIDQTSVDMAGSITDSGELDLVVNYQPATAKIKLKCKGSSGETTSGKPTIQFTAAQVKVTLSADGGATRLSQAISPEGEGSINIGVTPIK